MSSFLERYLAGECEAVWAELLAMGDRVREGSLHDDALGVARETMRRARHNLEHLIPRLVTIGYRFGYEWIQPSGTEFDRLQRKEYRDRLVWAEHQTPLLSVSTDIEDELSDARQRVEQLRELDAPTLLLNHWNQRVTDLAAKPLALTYLDALEHEGGVLPLSIRAWYEIVGGVNFAGMHSTWLSLINEDGIFDRELKALEGIPLFSCLEPMHIYSLEEARIVRASDTPDASILEFIPNGAATYGHEGTYGWVYGAGLPCMAADTVLRLEGFEATFVEYLRTCFRWGGFPGWLQQSAHPTQDLEYVTEGMLAL